MLYEDGAWLDRMNHHVALAVCRQGTVRLTLLGTHHGATTYCKFKTRNGDDGKYVRVPSMMLRMNVMNSLSQRKEGDTQN